MVPDHKKRIPVTLDEQTIRQLDALAAQHRLRRSTVIAAAIHASCTQLRKAPRHEIKDMAACQLELL